jgi:chorismate synthase
MSIPATKSFEIGSGRASTLIPGHIHNDPHILKENGQLGTSTNFSGGIQGGITNGEDVYFKVSFKSVATIGKAQETVSYSGEKGTLEAKGRHDPCVLPRAVPIVEAMAALVIMDMVLIQLGRKEAGALLGSGDDIPGILKGKMPTN